MPFKRLFPRDKFATLVVRCNRDYWASCYVNGDWIVGRSKSPISNVPKSIPIDLSSILEDSDQENAESIQKIHLLYPKELQKEAQKHNTSSVHLGCIKVGISALTHKGLNNFVLATIRDMAHNKYTDFFLGGVGGGDLKRRGRI